MNKRRWLYVTLLAAWLCLAAFTSGCSSAPRQRDVAGDKPANALVGEAILGTAGEIPGRIVMSDEAAAFEPPETLPAWRIVPSTPLSTETMDQQATRLGVGEPRTYGAEVVSDSRWILVFSRGDADCFMLDETRYDEEMTQKFEAGEEIPSITVEQARLLADDYLKESATRMV